MIVSGFHPKLVYGLTGPKGKEPTPDKALGKEDFLKLLIVQLTHQDPLNPMDDREFIAQAAQFSALEQMQNLNESFSTVAKAMSRVERMAALGLIGREVEVMSGTFEFKGEPVELKFRADKSLEKADIRIYSSEGELVKTLRLNGVEPGEGSVRWDGKADDGREAKHGAYRYEVIGYDEKGNEVQLTPKSGGKVSGVRFKDDEIYLVIGDKLVPGSSLVSVEG